MKDTFHKTRKNQRCECGHYGISHAPSYTKSKSGYHGHVPYCFNCECAKFSHSPLVIPEPKIHHWR